MLDTRRDQLYEGLQSRQVLSVANGYAIMRLR